MKIFDIDWDRFLVSLPEFEKLSPGARRALLTLKPSETVPALRLEQAREELVGSGLVVSSADGRKVRVADTFRPSVRALRGMKRSKVFRTPNRDALWRYLSEHLTHREIAALAGRTYGDCRRLAAERVASRVWITAFLGAGDGVEWETDLHEHHRSGHFHSVSVFELCQSLVQRMVDTGQPLGLDELAAELPETSRQRLAAAVHGGLRYCLFFAALDDESLAPFIGIFPPVLEGLRRPAPKPPEPVLPAAPCRLPFALDDMTAVLIACAADPPRLKSQGFEVFARTQGELEDALTPLPGWLESKLELSNAARVEDAIRGLWKLEHVESRGKPGRDLCLAATEKGTRWLALPEKERLKSLLDRLTASGSRKAEHWGHPDGGLEFVPSRFAHAGNLYQLNLADPLVAAFTPLEAGAFFDLKEFLHYRAQARNPLLDQVAGRPARPDPWGRLEATEEALESLWADLLFVFLIERLFAFGGAELAIHGEQEVDGERWLCFSITEIGRYLLGQASDFDYLAGGEGEVVVQPDFEVIFLAPSPQSEAALGRFASRQGHGMGALFRINRESIFGAAASGMTREQVLETLERVSSKPVPANVARQVSDWFSQCRRVSLRHAVLVRCPDPETAGRVLAAGGRKIRPLTDTVLEIDARRLSASLRRKLREEGVFVEDSTD